MTLSDRDLMCVQGVELGPLEVTINSLQKSIMAEHEETTELQNMWLRNQHELVQLTKEQDSQQCDINNIKKQLTILQQKKLRTEGRWRHGRRFGRGEGQTGLLASSSSFAPVHSAE